MAALTLDNLTKIFDDDGEDIVAVDSLDLEIETGEFVVFVGPSGCGKSTTLRCIAGLEQVTSGEIRLGSEDITHQKPKNRDIAMVFQNYALYPHKTARENMAFGLEMSTDLKRPEIDERIDDVAAMMGIGDLLEKKPAGLSGGQQQRVALGRAIVRDPEVFLMDEPLSNLDAKLRTQMRTELQELQQELGTTTIYVTHDQTEAMTMGDRIVILDDGKLQQVGTPLECYHSPANRFVAGFIGSPSMNFVPVTLDDAEVLHHEHFSMQLPADLAETLREDGAPADLLLGIRPEDFQTETEATTDGELTVVAETVEPLGHTTHVHFELDGSMQTASVSSAIDVAVGDELTLGIPADRIHLFDRETGQAVTTAKSISAGDMEPSLEGSTAALEE